MKGIGDEYVRYLVSLLEQASRGDPSQQADLTRRLMEFGQIPKAEYYLASVLLDSRLGCGEMVRGMAGLMLKNGVRERRTSGGLVQFLLEGGLLEALNSADGMVRATAGSLIAGLFEVGGGLVDGWSTALSDLCRLTEAEGIGALAAMETVEKICEDCGEAMVYEDPKGLSFLVDMLIRAITPTAGKDLALRRRAIVSLNFLIGHGPDAVMERLDDLITALSMNGNEKRLLVSVCQCINAIFGCWPLEILDHLPSLMGYTFQLMSTSEDEGPALEACEFWLALVGFRSEGVFEIETVLDDRFMADDLIPVLMRNAKYSDDDPEVVNYDLEDDEVLPRHHITRNNDHGDVEEGEMDEAEASETDDDYQWNLRKCSAATLDALSHALSPTKLLPALLPQIHAYLSSSNDDWKTLEVGILVLGAIAEGCGESIESHLPSLWPGLCAMMQHPKPLIRRIAVWTCSRYARWAEEQGEGSSVKAAIQGMADPNAKVQLACCSALQFYSQRSKNLLRGYLGPLTESIDWALRSYSLKKCQVACLELVKWLGDSDFEATPSIRTTLMEYWRRILASDAVDDPVMFPLLEAIAILPMSQDAVELVWGALELANRQVGKEEDGIEFDVVIVAMDLIGSLLMTGNVPTDILPFEDIGKLIIRSFSLGPTELHQSSFGLLGDLTSCGHLSQLFPPQTRDLALSLLHHPLLHSNLPQPPTTSPSTANNAVWAFGVMAMREPWAVQKIARQMVEVMGEVLMDGEGALRSRGYRGNLAVAIGRALGSAEDPVALLKMVPMVEWIKVMRVVEEDDERISALLPVLHLANTYPTLFSPEIIQALSTIPQ